MALRSVSIGHAVRRIDRAAYQAARKGVNLSRPCPEEFRLAELLREMVPSAEMVKFGKNGSDATAAAIRLARAATGKRVILRAQEDAFLGVHDWFIGSTNMRNGIPVEVSSLTDTFAVNNISSVEEAFTRNQGDVAAVILEPAGAAEPTVEFLTQLKSLCTPRGAVLIFDEIVSGFRLALGGAQSVLGVTPDLSTFGKAMGNGYPISALVGRRELMELGGLDHERRRVFLLSSTYGAERASIGAALETLRIIRARDTIRSNAEVGARIQSAITEGATSLKIQSNVDVRGYPVSPVVIFRDNERQPDMALRTLFMQELVRRGILVNPNLFSPAACHRGRVVDRTVEAIWEAMAVLSNAIQQGDVLRHIYGQPIRPVFRAHN